MNLIQRLVKRLFFKPDQRYLMEMSDHGYIFETGFIKSHQQKEVVFKNGEPAPWFNYSFLDFLVPRLKDSFSIFEYGLGNSTLFFNEISNHCFGVEHNALWFEKVMNKSIPKLNYYLCENESYVKAIHNTNQFFDVIIVDGMQRNKCVEESLERLSSEGVVILDDSEREIYSESVTYLKSKGFKELRISGLKALGRHYSCTSVFYRANNCLEI